MECSSVDFPAPFSPCNMTSGCERSTIIGMWKFRLVKIECPRILKCIAFQDNRVPHEVARVYHQRNLRECDGIPYLPGTIERCSRHHRSRRLNGPSSREKSDRWIPPCPHAASRTQRKPILVVELSVVFEV